MFLLVPAYPGSPVQRAVKRLCLCVCVLFWTSVLNSQGKKNSCYAIQKTRCSAIAEGPRDVSYQLKSCQLPRNSAESTCTTSTEQIEVMKLEG